MTIINQTVDRTRRELERVLQKRRVEAEIEDLESLILEARQRCDFEAVLKWERLKRAAGRKLSEALTGELL